MTTTRSISHGSFTITRHLKAAPARVFQAFAEQAAKDAWFGRGDGLTLISRTFDFREGGKEHCAGRWKNGMVSSFDAYYHDIVENERIIYSYTMDLSGTRISVSQQSIQLTPDGSGTRLVLTEYGEYLDGYDDAGSREHGTNGLMDALETSLAE